MRRTGAGRYTYTAPTSDATITWTQVRNGSNPLKVWESGAALGDGKIVHGGGHEGWPQIPYFWNYDTSGDTWTDPSPPWLPQRRCLIGGAWYVPELQKFFAASGFIGHGSLPSGVADAANVNDGNGPSGPFMYDPAGNEWTDMRTLAPQMSRWNAWHGRVVYDVLTGYAMALYARQVSNPSTEMVLYSPHMNKAVTKTLPAGLQNRRSYGIAYDHINRKVVVFGGTAPKGWPWLVGTEADPYGSYAKRDTWEYDPVADTWTETTPGTSPPIGQPLVDHTRLAMAYHLPTGLCVLVQTPMNVGETDTAQWVTPTETWGYDAGTRTWKQIPASGALPLYAGHLMCEGGDLFALGGDDDAGLPSSSKSLYRGAVSSGSNPAMPPMPSCTVGASDFTISWTQEGATTYTVYRADVDANGFAGEYIQQATGQASSYVDTPAALDAPYAWAISRDGESVLSVPARNQLPPVENVRAWPIHDYVATAKWDALPGAASYNLYFITAPVSSGQSLTFITNTTLLEDDHVATSITSAARGYIVRAVDQHGLEGGDSPIAWTFPDAPVNVSATFPTGGSVTVSWDAPNDATISHYEVWHTTYIVNAGISEGAYSTWKSSMVRVGEPAGTSLAVNVTHPPADPAVSGQWIKGQVFAVRAVNDLGQAGFWSDTVSGDITALRPA